MLARDSIIPTAASRGRVDYPSIDEMVSWTAAYLIDHGTESPAQSTEFAEGLLKHSREREEAKGVSCRRGIKDNHGVLHRLHVSVLFVSSVGMR